MGKHLSTGQIRELVDIDRSHGGIGEEVQALIKCLTETPPNHYRVCVPYGVLPSYAKLRKEFGDSSVSIMFDLTWELHPSCVGMDRRPRSVLFFLHEIGWDWDQEELIEWGLKQCTAVAPRGYRPATYDEMFGFSRANPDLSHYVALGSSVLYGTRCVARVWSSGGKRFFGHYNSSDRVPARYRVLFVRI